MAPMPARPQLLGTLVIAAMVGTAAWLSRGALTLLSASPRATRVGFLPPVWLLVVAAVGALAVLLLVPWRRGWSLPLLVVAVVGLPWLPVAVPPAFLIWAGPLVVWLWVIAVAGVLAPLAIRVMARIDARWLASPGRAAAVAGLMAFAIYVGASRQLDPVFPGGDEPHYLIIAQSLLRDGDLKIENNHQRGDYLEYYSGPGMDRPHFLRRGQDGQIYSVHAPGLPVLSAPVFAAAGYGGVVVFLALMTAAGAMLVWRVALAITGNRSAAWFGWASVVAAAPVMFHAFAVYPEAIAGTIVMTGLTALVSLGSSQPATTGGGDLSQRELPAWRWLLHGAALAVLPWLHSRYAVLAAMLGLCLLARILTGRHPIRHAAAFASMPFASAIGWFGYFRIIYGTFSPAAPYGQAANTRLSYIPVGLTGLLFDQQFGIIPNAPVYLLACAGLVVMLRWHRRLGVALVVTLVPYLLVAAAYRMWWAGWSAPARFAVPALIPLGVPIAAMWARLRAVGRPFAMAALVVTVLITGTMTFANGGWLLFNDRDGYGRWLEWVAPLVNLPLGFPSLIRDYPGVALAQVALWGAVLGMAVAAVAVIGRKRLLSLPAMWLAVCLSLVAAATAGVWAVWAVSRAVPLDAATAQLDVLRRFDSAATPWAVELPALRAAPADTALTWLRVGNPTRRPTKSDSPLLAWAGAPAGVYRLAPESVMAASGTLTVSVGRSPVPVETWTLDPSSRLVPRTLRLPCLADALVIQGDEAAVRSIRRLALEPTANWSSRPCPVDGVIDRGARYKTTTVFTFDRRTHLEPGGWWIEGATTSTLVLLPDGRPSSVRLVVKNGAVANAVALESGRWMANLTLAAHEDRLVEIPYGAAQLGLPLTVRVATGFRPADTDPSSQDSRFLGCWLEIP